MIMMMMMMMVMMMMVYCVNAMVRPNLRPNVAILAYLTTQSGNPVIPPVATSEAAILAYRSRSVIAFQ